MGEISMFRALESKSNRIDITEKKHEIRSEFQRDRDRILYSKEFRRLSGKTQVFISGFDDHMRTRLTHTLEVAQIADTIARAIGLNEILVEAIAYGHDVGHTPFGHVGERTLNLIMNGCKNVYQFNCGLHTKEKGFKHNYQSYRVMTELEELYGNKFGLNLTTFTLWGVLNHSNKKYRTCDYYGKDKKCKLQNRNTNCNFHGEFVVDFYDEDKLNEKRDWTVEAAVVAIADEIAQRHHDIEDGIYAGILNKDELIDIFEKTFVNFITEKEKEIIADLKGIESTNKSKIIAFLSKLIVDFYTMEYTKHLKKILEETRLKFKVENPEDFYLKKEEIYEYFARESGKSNVMKYLGFEEKFAESDDEFQKYFIDKILYSELAQSMDGKADFIIRQLFKAYLSNPQQLPDKTIKTICLNFAEENEEKNVDEISPRNFLKEKLNSPDKGQEIQKIILRVTCDYIAGMTDHYAMDQFEKLYGSQKYKNY